MGLLMSLHPNPQATAFQRRRDDLRRSIENVLMHLSEDENKDIDPHFSEDLEQLLQLAEHLLDEVDYEGDKREEAGNCIFAALCNLQIAVMTLNSGGKDRTWLAACLQL